MGNNFYLFESGDLIRNQNTLELVKEKDRKIVPIMQIDSIYIFGHINLHMSAVTLLFEHDVTLILFSYHGRYLGRYQPKINNLGHFLIKQSLYVNNKDLRIVMIKEIVLASAKNCLFLMKYYAKNKEELKNQISDMESVIQEIILSKEGELLLLEARMKKIYYACFDHIIKKNDMMFVERSMFPPKNEVNAMMSYGYAILYGKLESIILRSRLNIDLPFVHGHSKSQTGLHHDIADIFKPIFVDRLIFRLINKGMIDKNDFEYHVDYVYLGTKGMKKWINYFEQYMKETVRVGNKSYNKYQLLSREVNRIANHVFKGDDYQGYYMTRW